MLQSVRPHAPGTYREFVDFGNKAVWLRSVQGARATTIDAQGQGATVCFASGAGPAAVLDGFTVTGGAPAFPPGAVYLQAAVGNQISGLESLTVR